MSSATDTVEKVMHVANAIASTFGLDRVAVIRLAREELHKLDALPPDEAAAYRAARAKSQ